MPLVFNMKCKLCRKELDKSEEDYCQSCKVFLEWKYKKDFKKRLEQKVHALEVKK